MRIFFLCSLFIDCFYFSLVNAEGGRNLPFQVGEKLYYDLSWGIIPVGHATMEVKSLEKIKEELCYQIKFSVRTNSFADKFYKVRTSILSTVTSDFSKSLRYQKSQQEGKTKRDILVDYDYLEGLAKYSKNGEFVSSVKIPNQVFDPLSIAYFFRLKVLVPESTLILPTCDGKSFRKIMVKTGLKKKISVPAGSFYAIETNPEMENLRGVFKKSPDGFLRVWYSADKKRIPVKISSKVVVGSFTAKLREVTG